MKPIIALLFIATSVTANADMRYEFKGLTFLLHDNQTEDALFCVDRDPASISCIRVPGDQEIEVCLKDEAGLRCETI